LIRLEEEYIPRKERSWRIIGEVKKQRRTKSTRLGRLGRMMGRRCERYCRVGEGMVKGTIA
jgi:hypothetical protein